MDGFRTNDRIVIIAATNRLDMVDQAVLRSGRFDVKIHIPLPNKEQRKGILKLILDRRLGHLHDIQPPILESISSSS